MFIFSIGHGGCFGTCGMADHETQKQELGRACLSLGVRKRSIRKTTYNLPSTEHTRNHQPFQEHPLIALFAELSSTSKATPQWMYSKMLRANHEAH